jgi:hypothetical protein
MSDKFEDTSFRLNRVVMGFSSFTNPGKNGTAAHKDKYDRYSITAIIEPGSDNYKKIAAAIVKAAKSKFSEKADARIKGFKAEGKQKFCFLAGDRRTGEDGEVYPGFAGKFALAAANKGRPTLLDRSRTDVEDSENIQKLFYAGATVNLVVDVYARADGFPGIFCQLKGIQHVAHGERLGGGGGRVAKKDEFEDLGDPDESESGDDLVGAMDDDIPF